VTIREQASSAVRACRPRFQNPILERSAEKLNSAFCYKVFKLDEQFIN